MMLLKRHGQARGQAGPARAWVALQRLRPREKPTLLAPLVQPWRVPYASSSFSGAAEHRAD